MKTTILKKINSWYPKKKPEVVKSSTTIPETPSPIDYKKWFNENNG